MYYPHKENTDFGRLKNQIEVLNYSYQHNELSSVYRCTFIKQTAMFRLLKVFIRVNKAWKSVPRYTFKLLKLYFRYPGYMETNC